MSTLKVGTIQDHANSTTAMTIDNAGRILTPARPAFYAKGQSGQGAVSASNYIVFPSVDFDIGSNYNSSTGTFTAPIAGIYQFHASVMGDGTDARLMIRLYKNGAAWAQGSSSSNGTQYQDSKVSTLMSLSANDEIRIYQTGPKDTFNIYALEAYFWGMLVG
jgi:hypothetical protein|tara:strand:+ start:1200 stop:1685 length:486 start_codon:yes stop_codon:yes gene_type:complete